MTEPFFKIRRCMEIWMRYASYASGANPPWDAPVRRHLFGRHFEIQHLGTVDALNDNLRERGASRVLAVEILVFFGTLHPVRYLKNYSLTQ